MRRARLIAIDERVIDGPREVIYGVLCDFGSYREWWPAATRPYIGGPLPTRIGTTIHLSNGPFVRWNAHVVDLRAPALIAMQYTGALRGRAAWRLEAADDEGTRVAYEIDIEPGMAWLRPVFALWNLRAEHSRQIGRILEALHHRVRALTGPDTERMWNSHVATTAELS